jgi:GTPase involved in cell partitioning and DNA repair
MPIKLRACEPDQNLLKLENKIESFISEYLNKVLFTINKNYDKRNRQRVEKNGEDQRNNEKKRQTFVSHFSRKYMNSKFNSIKLPEKRIVKNRQRRKKKMKAGHDDELIEYIP